MGRLSTSVNYSCDNCLKEFSKKENDTVDRIIDSRSVILESLYNLNTGKKVSKPLKYEYYLDIEIEIARGVGVQDYYHREGVVLCDECKKEVMSKILKETL